MQIYKYKNRKINTKTELHHIRALELLRHKQIWQKFGKLTKYLVALPNVN
jgi:hypothetical protein